MQSKYLSMLDVVLSKTMWILICWPKETPCWQAVSLMICKHLLYNIGNTYCKYLYLDRLNPFQQLSSSFSPTRSILLQNFNKGFSNPCCSFPSNIIIFKDNESTPPKIPSPLVHRNSPLNHPGNLRTVQLQATGRQSGLLPRNRFLSLAKLTQICVEAYALDCNFTTWKTTFSQNYLTTQEDEKRHLIFCGNCTIIKTTSGSYTLALNQWTASTQAELASTDNMLFQVISDWDRWVKVK